MSISFGGLVSNLPVNDIITQLVALQKRPIQVLANKVTNYQKAKSSITSLQTKFSSLRSSIEKLTDSNLASTLDLFNKKTATSSDEGVATATASNNAVLQTFNLNVINTATSTRAASTSGVANLASGTTTIEALANNEGTGGTFSIYVDGVKNQFTVDESDDIQSVLDQINNAGLGINASIAGGQISLGYDDTAIDVTLGSSNDTSNFLTVSQLNTGSESGIGTNTAAITSANTLSAVNTSATLTDNDVNFATAVTAGTFTIGNAQFTVDASTSLDDIIGRINSDPDAGVTASFNSVTNQLELTADEEGGTAINLQNGTSNFLQAVNLITPGGNSLSSQTLGTNAQFKINNGATIEAVSNTVGSDVTGLSGVTLSLTDTGTSEITVGANTDDLVTAIEDFVNNFNGALSGIVSETGKDKPLEGDGSLLFLRSNLRSQATNSVDGLTGGIRSLADIGISTGAASANVSGAVPSQLAFDSDAFKAALIEDPDAVRDLLIGDNSAGVTGVLEILETTVENAVASEGLLDTRKDTFDTLISTTNKSITKAEARVEAERVRLVNQFNALEKTLSQIQSQGSSLSGLKF